jgi:2-dehydropantoate 2-reductase
MSKNHQLVPDPEVPAKAQSRTFSASYKARILAEYDAPGADKGALLRREGLYTSLVSAWRQQRDQGALLVFNNLWVEPLAAIASLPADQVAWGFPGAGGGFGDDGVLRGALLPMVYFGALDQPPTEREQAVRNAFRQAGFKLQEQADFRGWLSIHFMLKLGSLAKLAGSPGYARQALLAIRELLPLVEARGVDLRRHRSDVLPLKVPAWLTAPAVAWLLGHFPPVRLVLRAHANPEELRAVCRDTLAEARRLGVTVPRLAAAEPYFTSEKAN